MSEIEWAREFVYKPWRAFVAAEQKILKRQRVGLVTLPIFPVKLQAKQLAEFLSHIIVDFMGPDASMQTVVLKGRKKIQINEKITDGWMRTIKLGSGPATYIKTADAKFFAELQRAYNDSKGDRRRYLAGVIWCFLEALRREWIRFEPEFPTFTSLKHLSKFIDIDRDQMMELFAELRYDFSLGIEDGFLFTIRIKSDSNLQVSSGDPALYLHWERLSRLLRSVLSHQTLTKAYAALLKEAVAFVRDPSAWNITLLPIQAKGFLKNIPPTLPEKIIRNTATMLGYNSRVLFIIRSEHPIFASLLNFENGRLQSIEHVPMTQVKAAFKSHGPEEAVRRVKLALSRRKFVHFAICTDVRTINKLLSPDPLEKLWLALGIQNILRETIIIPANPFVQEIRMMPAHDIYLKVLFPFIFE